MTSPEAPSFRRIVTTSFDVAFPIFMGLGLATAVSLMIAFLFQSIAWDDPRVKMSAAMTVQFSYELGSRTHRRTVYLLPQPHTELLEPGCSVDVIVPREWLPSRALIREAYE